MVLNIKIGCFMASIGELVQAAHPDYVVSGCHGGCISLPLYYRTA